MKKIALAASLVLLSAGSAFAADPVTGLWKTQPGDTGGYAHVQVSECGSNICGVIKDAYDASGEKRTDYENIGKRMIWDMSADGGGAYSGGKIWAPDRNKTYKSKMQLSGNNLTVKGCVAVICRSQKWTRVK
ncbi:DUF2147 domain-containing protein [Roseovarius sp. EL26]|uniref:DUF2147 domain-containing protein n=1 Tax=Roseovarius sp. EL26 TaxID=2126672 RepID=UPI000EA2A592|nr:DUF2147 domain-containing protein [Roseovarius sp. EL26]